MQNNPLLVIFLCSLGVVLYFVGRQQTTETLTPLAAKFNGTYSRDGFSNTETLTIPYHGYTLTVHLYVNDGSKSVLHASILMDAPYLPGLTLSTNSILKKTFQIEDENRVTTGDERFDFLFQVACDDPKLVGKIFSEDVRDALKDKILHMPTIEMTGDSFTMKSFLLHFGPSPENSARVLEHFTRTAISILDKAWC